MSSYSWQSPPEQIFVPLSTHLSLNTLISLSQTCKKWQKIWENNDVWKDQMWKKYKRFMEHKNPPDDTNFKSVFSELKIMYENFHNRTHWLVHPFDKPNKRFTKGYFPFKDQGYVAGAVNDRDPGEIAKEYIRTKDENKFFKQIEKKFETSPRKSKDVSQVMIFYTRMKCGDIVVMRNVYKKPAEYVIGEVVSDIHWVNKDYHKIPDYGELGIRDVHWHFKDVPHNKLTVNASHNVEYFCGQQTVAKFGENPRQKYGRKEVWDVARRYGKETTTEWFFNLNNVGKQPQGNIIDRYVVEENSEEEETLARNTTTRRRRSKRGEEREGGAEGGGGGGRAERGEGGENRNRRKRIPPKTEEDDEKKVRVKKIKLEIKEEEYEAEAANLAQLGKKLRSAERKRERNNVKKENNVVKRENQTNNENRRQRSSKYKVGDFVATNPPKRERAKGVRYWYGRVERVIEAEKTIALRWFERLENTEYYYESEQVEDNRFGCVEHLVEMECFSRTSTTIKWPKNAMAEGLELIELWKVGDIILN